MIDNYIYPSRTQIINRYMWYSAIKMLEISHASPPATLGAEAVTTDVGTADDEVEKVTTGVVVVGKGLVVDSELGVGVGVDSMPDELGTGVVVASTTTELV